jgi:peptide/nickel transport system permease protein
MTVDIAAVPAVRGPAPAWVFLLRRPAGLLGVLIVLLVVSAGALAPVLAPADPLRQAILRRLSPPGAAGPEGHYVLGSDGLGRDIASRLVYGARISLTVAATAVAIAGVLGVFLGLVAGYFGGALEIVLMRIVDIQLAIPPLVLYLAIIALIGPSLPNLILTLGVTNWVDYARIIYGETLALKQRQFVESARAAGASDWRVLARHVLPGVMAPVIIVASLQAGRVILEESSLSFLGLGVQPPTPSWGSMVADGLELLEVAWWVSAVPGLAILVTVLGLNLFGDWLRDYLDPRARRRHLT